MSEFYVGAEVGAADDHDTRGVIVDSHPDWGWLVWWCAAEVVTWHRVPELWLRECAPVYDPTRDVADEVWAERMRQRAKGYDDAHDDTHVNPAMLRLAAAALSAYSEPGLPRTFFDEAPEWVRHLWEKHGPRRRLVIAAALLVAEIERLDRAHEVPHGS